MDKINFTSLEALNSAILVNDEKTPQLAGKMFGGRYVQVRIKGGKIAKISVNDLLLEIRRLFAQDIKKKKFTLEEKTSGVQLCNKVLEVQKTKLEKQNLLQRLGTKVKRLKHKLFGDPKKEVANDLKRISEAEINSSPAPSEREHAGVADSADPTLTTSPDSAKQTATPKTRDKQRGKTLPKERPYHPTGVKDSADPALTTSPDSAKQTATPKTRGKQRAKTPPKERPYHPNVANIVNPCSGTIIDLDRGVMIHPISQFEAEKLIPKDDLSSKRSKNFQAPESASKSVVTKDGKEGARIEAEDIISESDAFFERGKNFHSRVSASKPVVTKDGKVGDQYILREKYIDQNRHQFIIDHVSTVTPRGEKPVFYEVRKTSWSIERGPKERKVIQDVNPLPDNCNKEKIIELQREYFENWNSQESIDKKFLKPMEAIVQIEEV